MGDPMADNPMLIEMVNQLTPFNYMFFFQQFPDVVPDEDSEKLKKSSIGISRNVVISFILGIVANVQFKRIPKINFLTWRKPLRLMLRPFILVTPYALFFKSNTEKNIFQLIDLHEKYYGVVLKAQRLGDPRILMMPSSYKNQN